MRTSEVQRSPLSVFGRKEKYAEKKLTEKQHEKELIYREYLYHPPATRTGISSSDPLQGAAAFS